MNQHLIPETIECARRDFPAAVFHHFELMRGTPRDPELGAPDPDVVRGAMPEVLRHWEGYRRFYGSGLRNRLARAAKARLMDLYLDLARGENRMPACHVYDTHLVLYETGKIAFCELTDPIGDVRDKDLPEILAGAEAARRKSMIAGGCTCTHSCFQPTNLAHSPREVLRVFDNAMRSW
ncbi:MAG: hypothetical protein M5R36_24770 [Deltaproteobacteria bacterium]|nr:hypothetical protein [Deltaproteobacteria bacterium]